LFKYVADTVHAGRTPNTSNVLQRAKDADEHPPNTRNYLSRGGTVTAVTEEILNVTKAQDDLAGDGFFFDVPRFRTEYAALPRCRNDSEWGMISRVLALEDAQGDSKAV